MLVVENDRVLTDRYAIWPKSEDDVRSTYSGSDGLAWSDPPVDVDLVVMGLSCAGEVEQPHTGSVTDRVPRSTDVPVFPV